MSAETAEADEMFEPGDRVQVNSNYAQAGFSEEWVGREGVFRRFNGTFLVVDLFGWNGMVPLRGAYFKENELNLLSRPEVEQEPLPFEVGGAKSIGLPRDYRRFPAPRY